MRLHLLALLFFGLNLSAFSQNLASFSQHGPVKFPSNPSVQTTGMGRVSQLVYHPTDSNIIYAVSASGGLFKSANEGYTWQPLCDFLPQLTCASLLVNPLNPNILYLGTGDANYNSTGRGVYKSTDGGKNWLLFNTGMGNKLVSRMAFQPNDTSVIIAACSDGMYKTINGAQTWVKKSTVTTSYRDLSYRPQSNAIIYAASNTHFYRSFNNGETWLQTNINSAITCAGIKLAVTAADTSRIYCVAWRSGGSTPFGGVYQSNNNGASFTLKADTPNILGYSGTGSTMDGQGAYNLCIVADPNNADVIYMGAINVWKSSNAGAAFTLLSHWGFGVHADKHDFIFSPFNPQKLYLSHDGGLDRTTNGGGTWTTLEDGLSASEFYKMGASALRKDHLIGGLQDNGLDVAVNKQYATVRGGDWTGDFAFDAFDSSLVYEHGGIKRNIYTHSTSAINGHSGIYLPHPTDSNVLFEIDTDVLRTSNLRANPASGVTWAQISNIPGAQASGTKCMGYAKSANGTLYVYVSPQKFYISTNVNSSIPVFTQLSSFPFNTSETIKQIETCDYDSNVVYVVTNQTRLYKSANRGQTWISLNKNLPANNFVKFELDQKATDSSMYVCTAFGVYYRNSSMVNWIPFAQGLPTIAQITDMEISNPAVGTGMMYLSTYGRGLWQSNLYNAVLQAPQADFSMQANSVQACPNTFLLIDHASNNPSSKVWRISPATGWSFINGTDSLSLRAEIRFNSIGSYTITQRVSNAVGSDQKSISYNYVTLPLATCSTTTTNLGGFGMGIQKFELASINHSSSIGASSYSDFSCMASTTVKRGNTYNAYITTGNTNNENQKVYIDYNNNGIFTDANELVGSTNAGKGRRLASITILNNAPIVRQFLRMRVVTNFNTAAAPPCGVLSYGESEDYGIYIDTMPEPSIAIETQISSSTKVFGPNETDTFYSAAGKIMAVLINNSSFNYGATTVSIDNAGNGAMNYGNNTTSNKRIASKTFIITPSFNNSAGNFTLKLFYTSAEINGWKQATSGTFANANVLKCAGNIANGTIANGVYGSNALKVSYEGSSDSVISATFNSGFGISSGFALAPNSIVLPVGLLNFELIKKGEDALLSWQTSNEINNDYFEVLRSSDRLNFKVLGRVKGKGNSQIKQHYVFTDASIEKALSETGILYYRLNQVDFDGKSTLLPTRSITQEKALGSYRIIPQPVQEILHVVGEEAIPFKFEIFDAEGKHILKGSSILKETNIDVSHLAPGLFYLQIKAANGTQVVLKFIKTSQ
jgi:photosystem II stability/assembly factor-like uncharacterized protein